MYDSKAEAIACPKGNIRLVEDLETGLVYNSAFSPELMSYDGNYQNEQAVSPLFQRLLDAVATAIDRSIGKESLVEVGCGKGFFLEMLLAKGFDVTGFDPTYEGANPRVKRQYFVPGAIEQANGLILRHVLEHIHNPVSFLEQLKEANGGSGKIYIEVPCFDWICEHKAWFDIFYEHVNYFRLADFKRIFAEVIDSGRVFGGQYLYVIAELSSLRKPKIDMNNRVNFPSDFANNIAEQNRTKQLFGAALQKVSYLPCSKSALAIQSALLSISIRQKQGKYLPGTGLRVKSSMQGIADLERGATIFIMNSNYLEEIKQMSINLFNYISIDHE